MKSWKNSTSRSTLFCYYVFLFLLTGACVDPLALKLSASDQLVVVDGLITDQPGPYLVRLYHSSLSNTLLSDFDWITKAVVTITDSDGVSEVLTEITAGNYQTATMQGVIGKSYTLKIITEDGASYESSEEKILPVGALNASAEFVQNEPTDPYALNTTNGFNINADAKLLPEQEGRVRWRWTGTYEVYTYPELHTVFRASGNGVPMEFTDPFECSGYVASGQRAIRRVGLSTCSECWVTQYNDVPLLNKSGFEGKDSLRKKLVFIPANRRVFYKKYHIDVEQLSLSSAAYDFWTKVAAQRASSSDLFQTPPAKTLGNIFASGVRAQNVIGLFSASAVKKQTIVIDRSQIPFKVAPIDTIKQQCYYAYIGASSTKPTFY